MSGKGFLSAASALSLIGCATPDAGAPLIDPAQPFSGWAQACEKWDDWNKPGPAFRVHANTYYVGTCGIAAILITGPDGHALIDSGTGPGSEVVLANIEALGFDPTDIGLLLSSHEHFDHVGGLAKIQRLSGARYFAAPDAGIAMVSGEAQPDDPQVGMLKPFEPVTVAGFLASGVPVSFGAISITPLATPGHTPGAMTYSWRSCDESDCKTIVYADSLSPVSSEGYRFSENSDYIVAYRAGLAQLATLECDILLTPHPSASWLHERIEGGTGLVDAGACRRYAASVTERLDKRLAEEAAR